MIGLAVLFISTLSHSQSLYTAYVVPDIGKNEFKTNCASCHGLEGKGNGPVVDLLKKAPPRSHAFSEDEWWNSSRHKNIQHDFR